MKTPLELKHYKIQKLVDINLESIEKLIEGWNLSDPMYYTSRVSPKDEILLRALDIVVTKLKLNSWNVDVTTTNLREDFYELKLKITPNLPLNSEDPYLNFNLEPAKPFASVS